MKYNFDEIIDRRNTGSLKWDVKENELPMWVADMDFKTAPEIIEALEERVSHGVFGYGIIPDEWYDSYINWWKARHNFTLEKEWLIFCTGAVPAISSIVRKLTTPNENVVIETPVYNIFFNSIINNGARVLENRLIYRDHKYEIDFEDLEEKLSNPQTSLMILCNPHNPIGKIWEEEELKRIGDLAAKYHVTVISDEVHCDITEPSFSYTPFASVSENCRMNSITCIAPSKCFNLAGMQTAAVSVPDHYLRHKVWRGLNTDEVAEPNAFAVPVTVAAFTKGEDWLNEFNEYIAGNRKLVSEFISENIKDAVLIEGHATYLLWIDMTAYQKENEDLAEYIRAKTGLYLASGEEYGESGKNFIRMNVACPRATLKKGLELLKEALL